MEEKVPTNGEDLNNNISRINSGYIFQYTEEEVDKIKKTFNRKLDKVIEVNKQAVKGIPFYKVLFFLLDKMGRGNYYGTVKIKIEGNVTQDPKEDDVTHRLDFKYRIDINET